MSGCLRPTRAEINASLWLNNTELPEALCSEHKELWDYGFYRRLNNGRLEFIPFCGPDAKEFISMHETDFDKLMEKYVPENKRRR